jgi:hypothetical protein
VNRDRYDLVAEPSRVDRRHRLLVTLERELILVLALDIETRRHALGRESHADVKLRV